MRAGIKRLLKQRGFRTELFNSVEDFYARAEIRQSACLVLDIKLKNKSEIDLRKEMTNAGIPIQVIFIPPMIATKPEEQRRPPGALLT